MAIPNSEMAVSYKALHRMVDVFIEADDELRFAEVNDETEAQLRKYYELAAEAVVRQINLLRSTMTGA